MTLAINLLALVIVLGMCWGAMMWLSQGFHGRSEPPTMDVRSPAPDDVPQIPQEAPCATCEGVGARHDQGTISPCKECYGTGVLSA